MQIQVLTTLLTMSTALASAAACDGFDQLRLTLNTNEGGLADALRECVAPLLFAPAKWMPASQAKDFCKEQPCIQAVQQLKKLPSCTWSSRIPSGSDANTLAIAQQVMSDCA